MVSFLANPPFTLEVIKYYPVVHIAITSDEVISLGQHFVRYAWTSLVIEAKQRSELKYRQYINSGERSRVYSTHVYQSKYYSCKVNHKIKWLTKSFRCQQSEYQWHSALGNNEWRLLFRIVVHFSLAHSYYHFHFRYVISGTEKAPLNYANTSHSFCSVYICMPGVYWLRGWHSLSNDLHYKFPCPESRGVRFWFWISCSPKMIISKI